MTIELERETDAKKWLASIETLPGVMAYGDSRDEAIRRVQALALRVIADRIEHKEIEAGDADLSFVIEG